MKKLFYFCSLCLFCHCLSAQIVNIPDANFKAKLLALGIDTSQDGEIQTSEALAITYLNVANSFINNFTGLEAFLNLDSLNCEMNFTQTLDVSALTNLKKLDCHDLGIETLNVTNCVNLKVLYCYNTSYVTSLNGLDVSTCIALEDLNCTLTTLTSLDVSACPNLKRLFCSQALQGINGLLSSLNVTGCTNLETLHCEHNSLTSLDVSTCTSLKSLFCTTGFLNMLDVSNHTNLDTLECASNNIQTLNINGCVNLQVLGCGYNQISNLTLNTLPNLYFMSCNDNQLTNIDLSGLNNLWSFYCNNNQIQSINVNACVNLTYFYCENNQVQTLNLSDCANLYLLYIQNNPIISLFIKNGSNEMCGFLNTPNLQYICVDDSDIPNIQQSLNSLGMTNVVINSFCSFTPSGNYNSVSGKSVYDANINGCTLTDSIYPFLAIAVTNGIDTSNTYVNVGGDYVAYLDTGTYTFIPIPENPIYFSVSPITANVNFPNNNNNLHIQDFCITPNGNFPDIEISLIPLTPARPGFNANYQVFFHNKGTTIVSGDITLNFMGNKMTFVSANPATSTQTANQLTWNYSNLQPFESRNISFTMHILPPVTNVIGDEIGFSAYIPLANDAYFNDNHFDLKQTLVGSFDPNDKTCLEGNLLENAKIGDYLHYLIRFQNTGSFYAENITVVDSIDSAKYEISSLQMLETSHNVNAKINNSVLQCYFENIMLLDSFTDEPASHGYILFKIKTKASLPQNSQVKNKAEIYFDYNLPVITNTEITTFSDNVSLENGQQKQTFKCYPNPVQDILTIESEKLGDFIILNVMGEILLQKKIQGKENIDISIFAKGMYFIQAKNTGIGQVFVKE